MQVRALLQSALCASKVIARNSESAHISKLFLTRADASTIEVSEMALRTHDRMREFELQSESAARNAQLDPLTSVYNRDTLLSMLFRETDRVQRMKTLLSLILFGFDDFSSWSSRLGAGACDDLLCQVVGRVPRLLRSYDVLGRVGNDEFLVILPGCGTSDAGMLAQRLRMDIFAEPLHTANEVVRLSACFGIASSEGRSPVVVLREAEQALQSAKEVGPGSIACFGNCTRHQQAQISFLSFGSGDEPMAW